MRFRAPAQQFVKQKPRRVTQEVALQHVVELVCNSPELLVFRLRNAAGPNERSTNQRGDQQLQHAKRRT